MARRGLQSYGIPEEEVAEYLGLIEARVDSGLNGAEWQLRWRRRHGLDGNDLVMAYLEHQEQGDPVHTWPL